MRAAWGTAAGLAEQQAGIGGRKAGGDAGGRLTAKAKRGALLLRGLGRALARQ